MDGGRLESGFALPAAGRLQGERRSSAAQLQQLWFHLLAPVSFPKECES